MVTFSASRCQIQLILPGPAEPVILLIMTLHARTLWRHDYILVPGLRAVMLPWPACVNIFVCSTADVEEMWETRRYAARR